MQVRILATGIAPDYYAITGDVITAHVGGQSDSYDLSQLPEGATLTDVTEIDGIRPIRDATRINGELHITLMQPAIAGQYPGKRADWRDTTIDAANYDPAVCYLVPTGMAGVPDYEIVWGRDIAGKEGWTVRKTQEVANG